MNLIGYKLIFITCLVLLPWILLSQTVSTNIVIINYNSIKYEIETYVNNEIEQWQVQGRYENTEDYKDRMSGKNRDNKIAELTKAKINDIAGDVVHLTINGVEYDPDNEVYKLSFVGIPPVYLKVPIANQEANIFDANKDLLVFRFPNYTLTDTGFALLNLTIYNPNNRKSYNYDYSENLTFKKNKVHLSFEPVTFKSSVFTIGSYEFQDTLSFSNEINVDIDIPKARMSQPNAVALVIGNKDYQKISQVDFAIEDAKAIRNYLVNTLGFKDGNVIYRENLTKSDFEELFGNKEYFEGMLYNRIKPQVSDVFIYYSGHGAPSLKNNKVYFVPVECDPAYLEIRGYSTETLYQNLARLPAKSITIILDACFSGEDVHKDISSVHVKVTDPIFMMPNGVLLSSSKATEPSFWYHAQGHGLFTYFFLRSIKDKNKTDTNSDGELSFLEIFNYISSQTEGIPYYARRLYAKEQNPTLQGNEDMIFIKF